MLFSSLSFLFIFLPVTLIGYYLSPKRLRVSFLLLASLLFYAMGEPVYVLLMIGSILANWGIGLAMDRWPARKGRWLRVSILLNLSLLLVFKYAGLFHDTLSALFPALVGKRSFSIRLPIGISFFTFQALSYVIDVYRGDALPQKNIFKVALYISLFPQLIAGPIVRYKEVAEQIDHRRVTLSGFGYGVKRFILGFAKKVLIANNMAIVAESIYSVEEPGLYPISLLWMGVISYGIQIFFDFSGYSDMAIGLGQMFGFRFEENFNYPYISKSFTEFWRRWHISLGRWFRDYVYIPLGGSRKGTARQVLNLFLVWLLTGIWHGANFTYIVWALSYFIFQMIEKFFVKPEKRKNPVIRVLWMIVTLFGVTFLWGIFTAQDLPSGINYCLCLIGVNAKNPGLRSPIVIRNLQEYWFFYVIGILFSTPIVPWLSKLTDKREGLRKVKTVLVPVSYMVIFFWAVSYLLLGAHNPFIYFNF